MEANLKEWLITNRNGSFSMGHQDRVPRRKYHGLWISRAHGEGTPEHLLLDVIERQIGVGEESQALVNFDFGQGAGKDGRALIREFRQKPDVQWNYLLAGKKGELTRTLRLLSGDEYPGYLEGIELEYHWRGVPSTLRLSLEPIFTVRDAHALSHENLALDGAVERIPHRQGMYRFQPFLDSPEFHILLSDEQPMELSGDWYRNFFYSEEKSRGYPASEDGFCPARFQVQIRPNSKFSLRVMMVADSERKTLVRSRVAQRTRPVPAPIAGPHVEFYLDLAEALESYLFSSPKNPDSEKLVAGYPWFSPWARDTFISLPGLSLSWNNPERALRLLQSWVPILDRQLFGISRKSDSGPSLGDLNSSGLDSPWLWSWALRFLLEQHPKTVSRKHPIARELMGVLQRWVLRFFEGEHPLVQVTDFGLRCAPGAYASSWMDALVDGNPVTPRHGYPIEINSLFFDTLEFLLRFQPEMKAATARLFSQYLETVHGRFGECFWVAERGFVGDGHDGAEMDQALRSNQLWALNAKFELFSAERARSSLERITSELLTPFGLRTLSPLDSRYQGTYRGDQPTRDRAYHQGTVWPWLIGPYTEAAVKHWGPKRARAVVEPVLASLKRHFYEEGCIGQISEIFDADAPHGARGAPAQAWSVAETLRAIWILENSRS